MIELKICPACHSKKIYKINTIPDHFLSKELFGIFECDQCHLLFTNPRPDSENLFRYYQSDEYLSHTSSKAGLFSFLYRSIRTVSIKKKYNLINNYKSGKNILDIGCGTGEFLKFFSDKNWNSCGIEPVKQAREFARKNYHLNVYDESKLNEFDPEYFDVISMWHVLEHVPDLTGRITQIKRLLRQDGILVFALPNIESWDALHYKNFWAAWDVPRHLYHFSQSSFNALMNKNNLEIISIKPMKFDAFYVSLLSEKYQSGKKNFLEAFINGIKSNNSANKNLNNYSSLVYLVKFRNS